MSKKSMLLWGAFAILFGLTLYGVRGILFPFVLSFVLAYLLNPISEKLAVKTKMPVLAPFFVVAGGIVLILLSLMLLIPILQTQVTAFADKVPSYASALWQKILPMLNELEGYMDEGRLETLRQSLSGKSTLILREVGKAMMSLFSGGMVLFDVATFVIITPVITYYLLADWNKITAQVENLFPRPYVKPINKRLKQIDTLLSAFVRGQAMVCLFLALFYGVGLTLIGVDLGFAVGFLAGVFSFVPYMGTMTGFVLSLLLALTQGASWPLFALIVAVFLIGQFIEGYILTPKLVGDKVGLHPAWIIFALFAGGALFGFTGVLLAVPLFTILKVVGQVVIEAYQKTAFYKGKV
ncbi:MAG: AI-2E family transporter [Alphaproteobacteria bacterium]|nr:AI-2E family transporter [Alphaproteobacteria bacterium]